MLQYEICFLTKFPDRCGAIKWTNFRYRAECETKKARAPERENARKRRCTIAAVSEGNDLCMTAVYCALAGSAGWWTLNIYIAGGVTETLNLKCLGCCVRLGGATNLRVAVPLLWLRVR